MRLVIQRVSRASVSVYGRLISAIGHGMMILVGVETGDTVDDVRWLADKVAHLRIFDDEQRVMNLDITQVQGNILAISQFTLTASTRKGNRPSYIRAARPELAAPLYEQFCDALCAATARPVARGIFGADMQVSLTNDGPVTIVIDSRLRE